MIDELFILDAGTLSLITNPQESDKSRRCKAWMRSALADDSRVVTSEVTDYELRRELIRAGKAKGLARLDTFAEKQGVLQVDGRAWHLAADLWATARRAGKPTAPDLALDADVILAAVARLAAGDGWRVVVVTDNVGHLSQFVGAKDWRSLASANP